MLFLFGGGGGGGGGGKRGKIFNLLSVPNVFPTSSQNASIRFSPLFPGSQCVPQDVPTSTFF